MKSPRRSVLSVTAGFLAAVLVLLAPGGSHAAGESSMAPDFTLQDMQGTEHTLSKYRGKYVVLEWLNFGCPCVGRHYSSGNMPMLQKKYGEKGVVWLSIVSSAPGKQGYYMPDEMKKIAGEKGWAGTGLLLDSEGKVGRLFGAKTTPHMFVIDPAGNVIYKGAIDDNPNGDEGEVKNATNWVAAALDQAMKGKRVNVSAKQPYGCAVKY